MNFERTAAYFKSREGVVAHLYLDTADLVTVAIGAMLPFPSACAALPFVRKDGSPASDQEKREEWFTIKALEPGHVASYYEPFCKLILPEAAGEAEFARRAAYFVGVLCKRWPGFDVFPESAQLGLLDMVYSLGERGFLAGYPKLCAAVDAGDWKTAGAECGRRGVSYSRNAYCAELFASCAA